GENRWQLGVSHQCEGRLGRRSGIQSLTTRQHALERCPGRHDTQGGNAKERLDLLGVLDIRIEVLEKEREADATGESGHASDQKGQRLPGPGRLDRYLRRVDDRDVRREQGSGDLGLTKAIEE